jgi:hypothetical protein
VVVNVIVGVGGTGVIVGVIVGVATNVGLAVGVSLRAVLGVTVGTAAQFPGPTASANGMRPTGIVATTWFFTARLITDTLSDPELATYV